jgi:hypothetical protein
VQVLSLHPGVGVLLHLIVLFELPFSAQNGLFTISAILRYENAMNCEEPTPSYPKHTQEEQ